MSDENIKLVGKAKIPLRNESPNNTVSVEEALQELALNKRVNDAMDEENANPDQSYISLEDLVAEEEGTTDRIMKYDEEALKQRWQSFFDRDQESIDRFGHVIVNFKFDKQASRKMAVFNVSIVIEGQDGISRYPMPKVAETVLNKIRGCDGGGAVFTLDPSTAAGIANKPGVHLR